MKNAQLRYRQVHLDFHTSEHCPNVGGKFDEDQFIGALKKGHVNSITIFAQCHHGWCYYPTKTDMEHPTCKPTSSDACSPQPKKPTSTCPSISPYNGRKKPHANTPNGASGDLTGAMWDGQQCTPIPHCHTADGIACVATRPIWTRVSCPY